MNRHSTYNKGGSIIEMIVSFAILSLAITAVILVSFGNQESAVGSELNNKALYLAEGLIEDAYGDAADHAGFMALASAPLTAIDDLFSKELIVTPLSDCRKDVEARISWSRGPAGEQNTSLTNTFTDIVASQALGGDCPTEELETPWETVGLADSEILSGFPATDIDVVGNMIYLTTAASDPSKSDFFIYEFDPNTGSLTDAYPGGLHTGEGLYALDVALDYAFAINKARTPPPQPKTIWQLQVIKVSNPTPVLVQSVTLPDLGDGAYPVGLSIYYHDEKIYVGTAVSADEPELYVFDVSNPETIPLPNPEDAEIGHDVRAIAVKDGYVYLGTSNIDQELVVVDAADLDVESGLGFDAVGEHWGSAITLLSDRIYFGLRREDDDADHDFFVLERDKILNGSEIDDGVIDSADIGISNNAFVAGIVVRKAGPKMLAFLGLDDSTAGMEIWDISASPIRLNSECTETNFSENSVGIDMEGNYIFTANSANAKIRVFKDPVTACTP
jgi:type II secretory pathway pseudopilin PulG